MKDIKELVLDYVFENIKIRDDLLSFYKSYLDIEMTIPQLIEHLNYMPGYILFEIADGTYTDTNIREEICSLHSNMMIGQDWPTYGDGELVAEKFEIYLQLAYKEKGYNIL